jgi:hypothetical protein
MHLAGTKLALRDLARRWKAHEGALGEVDQLVAQR